IGAAHRELACFQVISSPHYSVVLGYPWLQKHNTTFDWRSVRDSLVVCTVWGRLHPLPFRATSFPLWIFHGPSEGFRRFCSGLVPVVFGPFSAFWDSLLSEVYQELLHAGQ
ncbi:unnamed protein product, partial [Staurois parvus]